MGYFREIIAYQNLKYNKAQIVDLVNNLIDDGWTIRCRKDNDEIKYTINAGDWITTDHSEKDKLIKELESLDVEKSWGGTQLRNEKLNRIVWLYQYEHRYRFELQISADENELELFQETYKELESSIQKIEHIIHIEWKTHYSNDIIRSITDQYHEGVLILASSNRLKQYFSQNEFNGNFPEGILDLMDKKIIIAINCWDYSFQTIVEVEKITPIKSQLINCIEFEEDDELLVLHHGQFTMICDKKGDYKQYGFKDIIITIPIESPHQQYMAISKSGDDYNIITYENQKTQVEQRRNTKFCREYLPTFCESRNNNPPVVARVSAGDGVNVKVEDEFYNVLPLQLFDDTRGIAVKVEDEVYIIHQSRSAHLNSKNSEENFPKSLGSLLEIDFSDLNSIPSIKSQIASNLEIEESIDRGRDYFDFTHVVYEGNVSSVRECDYVLVTSVDIFVNEFLAGRDITASHVPGLIEDAFNNCPIYDIYTNPQCNQCKDPRCLIDYLVAIQPGQGLSQYQKEILMINYLRATFNLAQDEYDWFSTGQDRRDFAVDLYNFAEDCESLAVLENAFNTPVCVPNGFQSGLLLTDYNICIEDALNAAGYVNGDGITETFDSENENFSGNKESIPDCIKLDDGTEITVNFGTTSSDNVSADQEVAECLIDALVNALECLDDEHEIESIYISATTNGKHSATSNHSKALAIDLSRIDGVRMANMTSEELKVVKKLQECLEDYDGIRENFGPELKKKLNKDYTVGGHSDHIHFSVNSSHTCTFDVDDVKCD